MLLVRYSDGHLGILAKKSELEYQCIKHIKAKLSSWSGRGSGVPSAQPPSNPRLKATGPRDL